MPSMKTMLLAAVIAFVPVAVLAQSSGGASGGGASGALAKEAGTEEALVSIGVE
eukprot:gene32036-42751_t